MLFAESSLIDVEGDAVPLGQLVERLLEGSLDVVEALEIDRLGQLISNLQGSAGDGLTEAADLVAELAILGPVGPVVEGATGDLADHGRRRVFDRRFVGEGDGGAFDFEHGGEPAFLADAAKFLQFAEVIASESDVVSGGDGWWHRLSLADEVFANALSLDVGLLLASLIHQLVVDPHAFLDAILSGLLDVVAEGASVGGSLEGEVLGLLLLDLYALPIDGLQGLLQSIAESSAEAFADIGVGADAVKGPLEEVMGVVGLSEDQTVGASDGVIDEFGGLLIGEVLSCAGVLEDVAAIGLADGSDVTGLARQILVGSDPADGEGLAVLDASESIADLGEEFFAELVLGLAVP